MDRSAVKAIVDREIEPLMRRLGIPHWKIKVSLGAIPKRPEAGDYETTTKARAFVNLDYNSAHIEFDPEAFDDEREVIETLRHELYHVVISPFDLYRDVAWEAAGGCEEVRKILNRAWTHAMEKAVVNLGRMYCGLTDAPPLIAAKGGDLLKGKPKPKGPKTPGPKPKPMPKGC